MEFSKRMPLGFVLLMLAAGIGCDQDQVDDPVIMAQRSRFLLATEPAGAVSIGEAEKKLDLSDEVVLVGRIDAGDHTPWESGKASFVISEVVEESAGHRHAAGHDADNCPFCKRKAAKKSSMAIVQFQDEQAKVLSIDARKLFSLEQGQIVVVQGQATLNDLRMLVVSAQGIAIRR